MLGTFVQRRPYWHRYYIKADIVRDWKWNHKVKQHIMINGILDLNQYPSAKHEGTKTVTKCLIIEVSTISHDISCVQETVGTTSGCAASAASLGPSLQLSTLTGR